MQIRVRAIDLVDILAFLVVLGAFVQLLPGVISESFLLSFLTALLLKVVLELVMLVKKPVLARLKVARSPAGRIIASLCLMVVMAGSKFLVLELTAFVFGDAVQLGGFFPVTGLIVTLMLARAGIRYVLERPTPTR